MAPATSARLIFAGRALSSAAVQRAVAHRATAAAQIEKRLLFMSNLACC
jgi:hypothetical protein